MTRVVLLASLIAACSKSAPEAEPPSVQPPPIASDQGGADPLDGVARDTDQEERVAPPEEPPPPDEEQALDETSLHDRPRPRGRPEPPPQPDTQSSMSTRRSVGTTLDENALQLDE